MIDRNSEIIRLWNRNLSASKIAEKLGLTKNIVIGVVTRARDSGSGLITRDKAPGIYEGGMSGKKVSHKKRLGADPVKAISLPKLFQAPLKKEEQDERIIGIPLWDLESHSCRYPTSRVDEQHYFCGEPKRDFATSFCAEHHKIVWIKKTKTNLVERGILRNAYLSKQWLDGSVAVNLTGRK